MKPPTPRDALIGRNIRDHREHCNYTQADLAYGMHVSCATISAIEHGTRPLRVTELLDLAIHLRCGAFADLLQSVP